MTLVLSRKIVELLSGDVGEKLMDCWSEKQDLCFCLDKIGITSLNLAIDDNQKPRYMQVERHFSKQEMQLATKKYKFYNDGKEVTFMK